jgi:hypothetical protein
MGVTSFVRLLREERLERASGGVQKGVLSSKIMLMKPELTLMRWMTPLWDCVSMFEKYEGS